MSRPLVQIVVVPVWRRHWTFYARDLGKAVEEKGFFQRVGSWFRDRASGQYDALQEAKPGTIQGFLRRIADRLVDQVLPEERFLGTLGPGPAEVVHPASVSAKLVRRRLRLVGKNGAFHERWARIWGIATPLFVPLLLTPISNLPIVYSAWRWISHRNAARGATYLAESQLTFRPTPDIDHHLPVSSAPFPPPHDDHAANLLSEALGTESRAFVDALRRKMRWLHTAYPPEK